MTRSPKEDRKAAGGRRKKVRVEAAHVLLLKPLSSNPPTSSKSEGSSSELSHTAHCNINTDATLLLSTHTSTQSESKH